MRKFVLPSKFQYAVKQLGECRRLGGPFWRFKLSEAALDGGRRVRVERGRRPFSCTTIPT